MKDVLLVEDDKGILETLTVFFNLCYEGCRGVRTLDEAIKELNKKRPDIIFLDLLLCGENGSRLIEVAREIYPDTPRIVILSALHGADKVAETYGVQFIPKPFPLEIIEEMMNGTAIPATQ